MGPSPRQSGGTADAAVLKTAGGNPVRVRVPSLAPALECGKRPLDMHVFRGRFVPPGAMTGAMRSGGFSQLLREGRNGLRLRFVKRVRINRCRDCRRAVAEDL
jgi:hypothetical protein